MVGLDVARGAALIATAIVVGALVFRERSWLPALTQAGPPGDALEARRLVLESQRGERCQEAHGGDGGDHARE